jgi:hypothetical protein
LALESFAAGEGIVSIPNEELREVWSHFILNTFIVGKIKPHSELFNTSDPQRLAERLQSYLSDVLDAMSFHDLPFLSCADGKERVPEALYQHLLFGLFFSSVSSLGFETIKSNREAGDGRYDICLEALGKVIILELKSADEKEDLTSQAHVALAQIKERRYAAEFVGKPATGVGVGIRKKSCAVVCETL